MKPRARDLGVPFYAIPHDRLSALMAGRQSNHTL